MEFPDEASCAALLYARRWPDGFVCPARGMGRAVALKSRPRLSAADLIPDSGRVERMNRTIKDATVKRFHCDNHDQLRTHLDDFVTAYNFAKRLKTLKGLTPYEFICRRWTVEPERFNINPL